MDGLDDIWDQPLEPSPPRIAPSERATPARPSPKRRRTTLFFSSDEEGVDAPKDQSTYKSRTPSKLPKDIDALFDDKERVVAASLYSKAQAATSRFLPDRAKAAMHRVMASRPTGDRAPR